MIPLSIRKTDEHVVGASFQENLDSRVLIAKRIGMMVEAFILQKESDIVLIEIHDWDKGLGGISARVSISKLDYDETN